MTFKPTLIAIVVISICSHILAYANPNDPASRQSPAPTETLELYGRAHLHVSPRPTDSSITNNIFGALQDNARDRPTVILTITATNTCGWFTNAGSPLTCGQPGYVCTNSGSYRDCCTGLGCRTSAFITACLDATACTAEPGSLTTCCTADPERGRCVTYLWQTTAIPRTVFTMFNCDQSVFAGQIILAPTPPFSLSSRPTTSATSTTSTPSITSSSTASSTPSQESSSAATSSSNPTSSLTTDTTTSSVPSTTAETGSNGDSSLSGKNTHTGAIIGGAVGGAALIAILAAITFFLLRRHKQQAAKEAELNIPEKTTHDPPGTSMEPTIPVMIPPQSPRIEEPVSPQSPPPHAAERQYVAYHPSLSGQQHEVVHPAPSPGQQHETVHLSPSPEAGNLQATAGVAQDKRVSELEGQGKRFSELEGQSIVELPA